MKTLRLPLGAALALALVLPASMAAETKKTVCVIDSSALNTFVFQEVDGLMPGRTIDLRGMYLSTGHRFAPFVGSAMMSSTGTIRIGLFVHASATTTTGGPFSNDFTLSGTTDERFAGELNYDNDGDFNPNGTIVFQATSCDGIQLP